MWNLCKIIQDITDKLPIWFVGLEHRYSTSCWNCTRPAGTGGLPSASVSRPRLDSGSNQTLSQIQIPRTVPRHQPYPRIYLHFPWIQISSLTNNCDFESWFLFTDRQLTPMIFIFWFLFRPICIYLQCYWSPIISAESDSYQPENCIYDIHLSFIFIYKFQENDCDFA